MTAAGIKHIFNNPVDTQFNKLAELNLSIVCCDEASSKIGNSGVKMLIKA